MEVIALFGKEGMSNSHTTESSFDFISRAPQLSLEM